MISIIAALVIYFVVPPSLARKKWIAWSDAVGLPGYALPLEFEDTKVIEFYLVPYVGACIHVPPPPENQMVHVLADKPFKLEGLYTAVWVTGKMSVGNISHKLYFVDGSADVDAGCTLAASSVELYGAL